MSVNRIRLAGREQHVLDRAAAGDAPRSIAAALASDGIVTTVGAVRALLAEDARCRRAAAQGVAAASAVTGTALVIESLTALVRQGATIAARLAETAAADSRDARAWAEVARSAVAANHALHGIVSGEKPAASATVEEIARRVQAVYGLEIEGAADVAVPVPAIH